MDDTPAPAYVYIVRCADGSYVPFHHDGSDPLEFFLDGVTKPEAKAASPALMLHSTNLEQDIGRPLSVAWAFEPTRTRHIEVPVGVIKGNTGGLHSARTDGLSSHRVPSIVTGMLPLKLTGST